MLDQQFDQLLNEYRSIWNNRLLVNDGEISESILLEAIRREINDENSHPRIRRSKYEKFYLATKRIMEASIRNESKQELIDIHLRVMDQE